MEVTLKEVEVQKLDLREGEVLAVTLKHDDVTYDSLKSLQKQFAALFPNNKVLVFNVGTDGDIKLAVLEGQQNSVAPAPQLGYCTDCNCGKKDRAEGLNGPL